MHVIARLYTYYGQVQDQFDKDPGSIFNYYEDEEYNGLKIIAEIMVRTRRDGFATLFIPTDSVSNVIILPTTKLRYCFQIENKLDKLYKEDNYILCIQREADLQTGNFLLMTLDECGTRAVIYTVLKNRPEATKLTKIDFDYGDGIGTELSRMYRLCISELDEMLGRHPVAQSNFGSL